MNCQRIQDLILTDYTDSEALETVRKQVAQHIATCSACREFEAAVREKAVRPLQDAERVEAPERLWSRVTTEIYAQHLKPAPAGVLQKLKNLVAAPKPALALSTVAVLLVFGILFARPYFNGSMERRQLAALAIEDQIEYFAYGNGWGGTDDIGVGIEEIFS